MGSETPRKAVRLQDIAQQAGVTSATVSYALCGTKGVSEATRQRIIKIARELGYVATRQPAGPRGQRTFNVGLLVTDIRNPFFAEIIQELERAAAAKGYRVTLCAAEDSPQDEARHLQMLLEYHVEGLILVPVCRSPDGDYPNLDVLRSFQHHRIPVVCIVDSIRDLPTGRITTAVYHGTRMMVDHLIELGHRDIAYFSQPFQRVQRHGRHTAYQDALCEAGIPFRSELLIETGLTPDAAYDRTGWLLDQGVPFTAAVYANDYMAVGGLRKLRERGLRVPEDVSVTGFDDVEWARFCEVPLTTARFPLRQLAELAIQHLLEALDQADRPGSQPQFDVALRPEFIRRQSTGPAPAHQPIPIPC